MAENEQGGVFIPTDKIYELLRDHMSQTNERLTEIRSDIRSMSDQYNESRQWIHDHEERIRKIEEKKKDRTSPQISSAWIGAVVAFAIALLPYALK